MNLVFLGGSFGDGNVDWNNFRKAEEPPQDYNKPRDGSFQRLRTTPAGPHRHFIRNPL